MAKMVVLLVGPQGSGKTTWCRDHLPDAVRISQDDQGPRAHFLAYEEALTRGDAVVVVDRINGQRYQRRRYLTLAKHHGYTTRIVWLNADRAECLRRCQARTDHPTLQPANAEQALARYFRSFQIPSRKEADSLEIVGPLPKFEAVLDLCSILVNQRYLIVGDVHGCLEEWQALLQQVQFDPERDALISVGDLVDRGPRIRETLEFACSLPAFWMVRGNHEDKFIRYLQGRPVKLTGGLRDTVDAYQNNFPPDLLPWLEAMPVILRTPAGYVVHAGFDPERPPTEQLEHDCLYMRYHGGKTYFDEIHGKLWMTLWPTDESRVFFGHIPTTEPIEVGPTVALDGGCVFGGELRLFDSRDGQIHRLTATRAYAVNEYAARPVVTNLDAIKVRDDYEARGLLRSDHSDDGRLVIYTYTDVCVFTNAWDDITRNSRGHVFDRQTAECVAYPFPKFFNLGETPETQPDRLPWDEPYAIMEKMDGWLGVLYRQDGLFKVASRGSFHSPGAEWATSEIQRHDLSELPSEVTLCFEIITPEQRIILDYGDKRSLVILGAYNRFTGEEYPREQVEEWGVMCELPVVPLLARLSFQELLAAQKERQDFEGFVIRFHDGRRVKVKTEWYLELARRMASLTPITTWEALINGKIPEEALRRLPEELRPVADRYRAILEGQYARVRLEVERIALPLLQQFAGDRRGLAMHLQAHAAELGYRRSATFILADDNPMRLDRLIKDLIYPRGNRFVTDRDLGLTSEGN